VSRIIKAFAALFCLSLLFWCEDIMAIEEAKYSVIEREDAFELRQYQPQIIAETVVEGDFDQVGNEGFRRLFKYISGNNRSKKSISMNAPVSQEKTYEKITMTAPVNQEKIGEKWIITFLMPSQYTMENIPEPLDPRIVIKKIPGNLMASMQYSGTWSKIRYEDKKTRLYEMIKKRGLKPQGEPIFARYNPPFMPWFLRRNEVLIPVGADAD
jgi:hypothetical protein